MNDPHAHLMRAVLALAGAGAVASRDGSTPWASALFEGARHRFTLELPAAAGDR